MGWQLCTSCRQRILAQDVRSISDAIDRAVKADAQFQVLDGLGDDLRGPDADIYVGGCLDAYAGID